MGKKVNFPQMMGKVFYLTQSVHRKKKFRRSSYAYNSISEPDVI